MIERKPCFDCDPTEIDKLEFGECLESPLCADPNWRECKCDNMVRGMHWEDCLFGAKCDEYPEWKRTRESRVQCPFCHGHGSMDRYIADRIQVLVQRMRGQTSVLGMPTEQVCDDIMVELERIFAEERGV